MCYIPSFIPSRFPYVGCLLSVTSGVTDPYSPSMVAPVCVGLSFLGVLVLRVRLLDYCPFKTRDECSWRCALTRLF